MTEDNELTALKDMVSRFAREEIATRTDLKDLVVFPADLREAMAKLGLFGIGVPRAYEGMGGGWLHMGAAAQAIVEHGLSLGVSLSWLMHTLISRFVFLGMATDAQKLEYLPGLASGRRIPCLAISEPGVGGHPKKLTTAAKRDGDTYVISGEKAYLTNGPIADLFVVLAVTAEANGRKGYTAFIVPADTPGLTKTEPMDLGFLRPSPHGGIVLDGCRVPAGNVLGREHHAYADVALPFRQVEDVMMMAPFMGGAQAQIRMLASGLRERGADPGRDAAAALGWVKAAADTMEILAAEGARMLDTGGPDHPGLLQLVLFMRQSVQDIEEGLNRVVSMTGLDLGHGYTSLTNDLVSSMKIAGNVARLRQEKLGRSLLS
ncbi:MAG TPA: acyl-CoA dehydrogenase family protein [Deltaproteobacteria bacterium]|jgi:acyl-CoA dehydrogenase|nr:acyl-CoA dehydrogenase family protein [Deltaproteobacteria bacterium]HOI07642.1 acyl-CoA dehydrogenase family protein [Deltaproteobacteria bacterium]